MGSFSRVLQCPGLCDFSIMGILINPPRKHIVVYSSFCFKDAPFSFSPPSSRIMSTRAVVRLRLICYAFPCACCYIVGSVAAAQLSDGNVLIRY